MSERYTATLEWLNGDKGYGFKVQENGQDIFVQYTALPGQGFRILTEGNKFMFSIEHGPKGPKAIDIVGR